MPFANGASKLGEDCWHSSHCEAHTPKLICDVDQRVCRKRHPRTSRSREELEQICESRNIPIQYEVPYKRTGKKNIHSLRYCMRQKKRDEAHVKRLEDLRGFYFARNDHEHEDPIYSNEFDEEHTPPSNSNPLGLSYQSSSPPPPPAAPRSTSTSSLSTPPLRSTSSKSTSRRSTTSSKTPPWAPPRSTTSTSSSLPRVSPPPSATVQRLMDKGVPRAQAEIRARTGVVAPSRVTPPIIPLSRRQRRKKAPLSPKQRPQLSTSDDTPPRAPPPKIRRREPGPSNQQATDSDTGTEIPVEDRLRAVDLQIGEFIVMDGEGLRDSPSRLMLTKNRKKGYVVAGWVKSFSRNTDVSIIPLNDKNKQRLVTSQRLAIGAKSVNFGLDITHKDALLFRRADVPRDINKFPSDILKEVTSQYVFAD